MTIDVLAANAAPVFDSQNGWQVLEGQQLAFSVFSYDPDNPYYTPPLRNSAGDVEVTSPTPQTVTVEVIGDLPEGAVFDSATMQLRWTPENDQAGTYQFRFRAIRSEEHTSELQSLMRISYAVFCLKKKITKKQTA